jgi:hypothetical protein
MSIDLSQLTTPIGSTSKVSKVTLAGSWGSEADITTCTVSP